ncbi:DUF4150 domain-containing protein [Paraburkholderia sp. MMS20-SJTR3]|uniref:DUF4150 domain-containing protein n=1 Tax=Paraburkholderia sejongensis TaxID=2886946 RepID=A0ABS8JR33_9BURK|nr:PAAR-like domain-containing protein [Paraburkholderia sp. MMS20-SJTR3]MCC8392302.1 DUF4150 domain-containing protein [Paraburkholderia sp. MMS20-SJTR3]
MANQVYANNMEISCKAAAGKSICAFPDVCMTPPQTPATPPGVPIPYPNTGMASDTSDGSSTVQISGQEVMLKNKSYFKRSTGDEAGCAPKKGVVTSKNMGKVYFTAWSMDVKLENENVVRMMDLTTHNHGSVPGNTTPWPYIDEMAALQGDGPCAGVDDKKYRLTPHHEGCPGDDVAAHHLIPNRQMSGVADNYTRSTAPCICAQGLNQHTGVHGEYHKIVDLAEFEAFVSGSEYKYMQARDNAVESVAKVNKLQPPEDEKVKGCIRLQMKNYYEKRCGMKDDNNVKASGALGKNLQGATSTPPYR